MHQDAVTGRARVLAVCLILLASPASADPTAESVISVCLAKTERAEGDLRGCIGIVANACLDRGEDPSTAGEVACYDREITVWEGQLNALYKKVMARLPPGSARQLRDAERSWIETRQLSCAFYDTFYEGGTMARPMTADCYNRATAERVLYLRGFASQSGDQ